MWMRSSSLSVVQVRFRQLRGNRYFEAAVIGIIVFSALLIGAKTYDIQPWLAQLVALLDIAITVFFLIEILIRFLAEERVRDFCRSGWNIFDALIVAVSLLPADDSEMAFLGRLIRVFRVLRMVSIIPELRILLNSLLKALPQLGYVVALMFIIFYIYGAMGSMLFAEIDPQLWGDIAIAMLTLFRVMTFEDWTDVMYATMEIYPLSWIYYLTFIFFTAFAFLNMVIGIVVSTLEREHAQARSDAGEVTLDELNARIDELRVLIEALAEQRAER